MKKRKKVLSVLLLIIGIIFILSVIGIVNNVIKPSVFTSSDRTLIGEDIKLTNSMKKKLYNIVKDDIINSLKSPSSAVFPEMKKWTIRVNSSNIIEIKSYVDSQNSYGAMLRANFQQKYLLVNENEYLCIYKKFNSDEQFDITEDAENKNIINRRVTKNEIDDFVRKAGENQYTALYNKTIDYTFNGETQQLEWNIEVTSQVNGDLKSNCYLQLTAAIDECICIPTVETTINVYTNIDGHMQKVATVNNIDFEFMTKKWNASSYFGINASHVTTEFEEELGNNLVQEDIIKNMKVDYWNK